MAVIRGTIQKKFAAVAALVGWVSLVFQLVLFMDDRTVAAGMALVRFFSFFTILTNLIAALMFTAIGFSFSRFPSRLTSAGAVTAIAGYMTVVGIIYNTVLRGVVELHGLNAVLNELHHVILPITTLLFWLIFVPKEGLRWRMAFWWLIYPFFYIIWVILFGARTGWYPYPFTDVGILGYPRAIVNGVVILAGFLVIFFLMIGVGRIKKQSL